MIEQAYFKCEKCRSIEGGIYGKGPLIELHSDDARSCVHGWRRIPKSEFRQPGEQWHQADWSDAIDFWRE